MKGRIRIFLDNRNVLFYLSSPVLKLEVIYRSGFWLKPQVDIDKTRHDESTSAVGGETVDDILGKTNPGRLRTEM